MNRWQAMGAGALVFVAACGGSDRGAKPGTPSDSVVTVPAVPQVTVAAIAPNSYSGTLRCADCSGILTTVALFPDTTYRLRKEYQGKSAGPTVSMGRWTFDGGTLHLTGLGDTLDFIPYASGLDTMNLTEPSGPIVFVRADSMNALRETAPYTGTFSYMADAPTFRECGSGQTYNVLMSGAYKAVEKAYTAAKLPPGSGQQIDVQARFKPRPDAMEGPKERDVIELVKYVGPAANPDCR